MTTSIEDRIARLEAQVVDLTELVQTLGGRSMALEIAAAVATLQPRTSSESPGCPKTTDMHDRVYASLLATRVAPQFLEGFQQTAQGISEAAEIVNTIEGRIAEGGE